jgi:hypothetical protein
MKKELTEFVSSLLFAGGTLSSSEKKLHLRSQKQFLVNPEGHPEKEQAVLTDIYVGRHEIFMSYTLPDGREVSFNNPISDIHCDLNNDYHIGRIICSTAGSKDADADTFFVLECNEEDEFRFFGEKRSVQAGKAERTYFEILNQAEYL